MLQKRDLENLIEDHTQELAQLEKRKHVIQQKNTLFDRVVAEIGMAQNLLITTQQEYLQNSIDALNPLIEDIQKTLNPHPYWSSLNIELEKKTCKGIITNVFKMNSINPDVPNDPINIRGFFSHGQQNATIISLLLAFTRTKQSPLNFTIFDDVSQSLDKTTIENLAKLLSNYAKTSQIIVASSDEQFIQKLNHLFEIQVPNYNMVEFNKWSQLGVSLKS